MTPVLKASVRSKRVGPRVLIVDDEPAMIELIRDVLGQEANCRMLTAPDLATAQKIIADEKIDLLLADVNLPDGDGMTLLQRLHEVQPTAAAVIITGQPSMTNAITALRAGVVDFLPKPFSAEHLLDRVRRALARQSLDQHKEHRLLRLRVAVKKLNVTRHNISKKVDLLCNDLVSAYGDLSRQLDTIRLQESFRKLLGDAKDVEQLLCHAMDWILRQAGFCNVAVWLASDDQDFELGAYMKYTIAGEPQLTDAMRRGLVPLISREGSVHLFGADLREQLTQAECDLLKGQEILGCNCTYLGESLGVVVLFRDEKSPFTEEDVAMIRAVSPIFAVALAGIVRKAQDGDGEDGPLLDDADEDRGRASDASDWWKRGEPPPF